MKQSTLLRRLGSCKYIIQLKESEKGNFVFESVISFLIGDFLINTIAVFN